MSTIKFGTDGWRAVIAEDFTFANVDRVAQATADYWAADPFSTSDKKVVIGYDRRFLSDQFARRTAEVFAANDFDVVLTSKPTPTPAVSYAVKAHKAIKKLVDFKLISRSKLRFAHDPLFGVGAGCFAELLEGTTCKVTTLNAEHNPNFGGINPEPIPKNYGPTAAYLKKHPHDFCLVTDGDADRVGGMDGRGHPISTHQLICLLLQHFLVNRKQGGRMIK